MKKHSGWKRLIPVLALSFALSAATGAYAAETEGGLTAVNADRITGWAWNVGSYDETVNVELQIYKDGSKEPARTAVVTAASYSSELSKSIGDGYHAFDYAVNWAELSGTTYRVEAYVISGEEKSLLPDPIEIKAADLKSTPKKTASEAQEALDEKTGPGAGGIQADKGTKSQEAAGTDSTGAYKKGASLGIFTTSGYCTCSQCSKGEGKTYSGTIPKANHTISADLDLLPLGTKVMIGDIVYTVEDKGSGVNGKWIDIYYGNHEAAMSHGLEKQEVFEVIEE